MLTKILEIDLSNQSTKEIEIPNDVLLRFIGGRGIGAWYISKNVRHEIDPFSPENPIIFSAGQFSGTNFPFSSRTNATSISPLTRTLFSSNSGGTMGYSIASVGYLGIALKGKASHPTTIFFDENGNLHLDDASDIWNLTTYLTTKKLSKQYSVVERRITCIGDAAINKVKFANIITNNHHAFGRGGLGAVLASKNVKGFVFKNPFEKRDEKFKEFNKELYRKIKKIENPLKTRGTSAAVEVAQENQGLGTRYWQQHEFEGYQKIGGKTTEEKKTGKKGCGSCAVNCKIFTKNPGINEVEEDSIKSPEYETLFAMGANLGIDNFEAIVKLNYLANTHGIDTISTGNTISGYIFATGNNAWNEPERVEELIEKTVKREEDGNVIADGLDAVARTWNIPPATVKGLDVPGHDPVALHGMALGYLTSQRGADHLYSSMYANEYYKPHRKNVKGKASFLIKNENRNAVFDSLITCKFSPRFLDKEDFLKAWKLVSDESIDNWDSFIEKGANVVNLEYEFNKNVLGVKQQTRIERFEIPGLEEELKEYYKLRGWDLDS